MFSIDLQQSFFYEQFFTLILQFINYNRMEQQAKSQRNQLNNSALKNLKQRAMLGQTEPQSQIVQLLQSSLKNEYVHPQIYQHITDILLSAQPSFIEKLNKSVLPQIDKIHSNRKLDQDIILWCQMYNGSYDKMEYPNLSKTLSNALKKAGGQSKQLSNQSTKILKKFQIAFKEKANKKVQFFDDYQDSISYSSDLAQSRSDIIFMDMKQIGKIREKVVQGPITDEQADQYLIKIKEFLKLNPSSTSVAQEFKDQYKNQRQWARQFLTRFPDLKSKRSMHLSTDRQQIRLSQQPIKDSFKFPKVPQYIETKRQLKTKTQIQGQINLSNDQIHFDNQQKRLMQRNLIASKNIKQNNFKKKKIDTQENFDFEGNDVDHAIPKKPQYYQSLLPKKKLYDLNPARPATYQPDKKIQRSISHHFQPAQLITPIRRIDQPKNYTISDQLSNLQIHKHGNQNSNRLKTPLTIQNQLQLQFYGNASKHSLSPSRFGLSTSKKLSQFTNQKKMRKQGVPFEAISDLDDFAIRPYLMHFIEYSSFNRFRRNCLQQYFVIYQSSSLVVNCSATKDNFNTIRVSVMYINQTRNNLPMKIVYKIPQCFQIIKVTKISKKFILKQTVQHIFKLKLNSFPIQACILALSYSTNHSVANQVPISLTIKNFLQSLYITSEQWLEAWDNEQKNVDHYHTCRHIRLEKNVVNPDQMGKILHELIDIGCVQGYSIQQYGGLLRYSGFDNLLFLIRFSLRVDNFMTVELQANKKLALIEKDFIEYYLNIVLMLICQLDHHFRYEDLVQISDSR